MCVKLSCLVCVVGIGSVRPLSKEKGTGQGTNYDGDDPTEDCLQDHDTVQASGSLQ